MSGIKKAPPQDRLKKTAPYQSAPDDGLIICRCEEISKEEIRRAIHEGMMTISELRRFLRAGMGLCQGQTCGRLVKGILAGELGVNPAGLEPARSRPPLRPVEMRILAKDREDPENA
jgi:NAD(P)H-nitrite reductase large subunit